MSLLKIIEKDSSIVPLIQDAILKTLQVHSRSQLTLGDVSFKSESPDSNISVIGLIKNTHNNSSAILAIGFSEKAFIQIYENMFQEMLTEITKEAADLAGEIVNIVYQTINPELKKRGHVFEVSLPVVMTGSELGKWLNCQITHSLALSFHNENEKIMFEIVEISGAELNHIFTE